MIVIRNAAAEGFDQAIIAMRREHGGREVSDSDWQADADCGFCEFVIGEADRAECLWMIKAGDYDFMKFIGVWAHIEAPAQWWSVFGGYFIAQSDVKRAGDAVTRSVMTTYANLRNLMETACEITAEGAGEWETWNALYKALEELPESWMLLPEITRTEA